MADVTRVLVYVTESGHPTMWRLTNDIASGFDKLGCEVVLADLNDISTMLGERRLLMDGKIDFSVGVNYSGKNMVDDEGTCIYKYLKLVHNYDKIEKFTKNKI